MENLKKYVPYLYFFIAIVWFGNAIWQFNQDLDTYRIVFQFYSEDKFTYILAKTLIGILMIGIGVKKLSNQNKKA